MISCLPYEIEQGTHDKKIAENIWPAPNYTLVARRGEHPEHCLLHYALLNGLRSPKTRPFLCLGTLKSGVEHMWVGSFESNGAVRFWEPARKIAPYCDLFSRVAHTDHWARIMLQQTITIHDILEGELDEKCEYMRRQLLYIQQFLFEDYAVRTLPGGEQVWRQREEEEGMDQAALDDEFLKESSTDSSEDDFMKALAGEGDAGGGAAGGADAKVLTKLFGVEYEKGNKVRDLCGLLTHNNTIKLHYSHKHNSEHNELDGHTSAWPVALNL